MVLLFSDKKIIADIWGCNDIEKHPIIITHENQNRALVAALRKKKPSVVLLELLMGGNHLHSC